MDTNHLAHVYSTLYRAYVRALSETIAEESDPFMVELKKRIDKLEWMLGFMRPYGGQTNIKT